MLKSKRKNLKKLPANSADRAVSRVELTSKYPNALNSEGGKIFLSLLDAGKITTSGIRKKVKRLECKEHLLISHPDLLKSNIGVRFAVSIIRTSTSVDDFDVKIKNIYINKDKLSDNLKKSSKDKRKYVSAMAGKI
jgi:hypothetical protein